jgi:hypothetical protein
MTVTAGVVSIDLYGNTTGGNIVLRAVNVYDEALSEKEHLRGIVALRLKGLTQTLVYTSSDLQTPKMLSGTTLTILPKDTVKLLRLWDHITDNDKPFWSVLTFTKKTTENGRTYYESETAMVQVTATLQLFDRVPAMRVPPMLIPIVYRMENKPPDNPTGISGSKEAENKTSQN